MKEHARIFRKLQRLTRDRYDEQRVCVCVYECVWVLAAEPISDPSMKRETAADSYLLAYSR